MRLRRRIMSGRATFVLPLLVMEGRTLRPPRSRLRACRQRFERSDLRATVLADRDQFHRSDAEPPVESDRGYGAARRRLAQLPAHTAIGDPRGLLRVTGQ